MIELPPGVDDPARFERACLRAVEQALTREPRSTTAQKELIRASLVGSFPETAIRVRYRDLRDGSEGVFTSGIWPEVENADTPEEVAIAIGILLMEH